MKALCKKLNYDFKDMSLLETALTHPSYGGDHHVPHYQRLEFLGDAVLELAISRYLYFEFPAPPSAWSWADTSVFPWARIAPAGGRSRPSSAM